MANLTTNLFQTILAAANEASQAAKFRTRLLETIYMNYRGISANFGNTLNVVIPVPNVNDVANIGAGGLQVTDTTHNTASITVNFNQTITKVFREYDQVRTPQDLKALYFDEMLESLLRKINADVAAQITTTNFNKYSTVVSTTTAKELSRLDLVAGWQNIVGAGCPMSEGDIFFLTHQVPYSNMLADPSQNFLQQYVVGDAAAVAAQQHAMFAPQFGAIVDYDQQFPTLSATQYYGLFYSRYAIAMVPVTPPKSDNPLVVESYIYPKGPDLPIRVQSWYDPMQQGHILNLQAVYGLAVIRPEFASLIQTQ